MGRKRPRSDRLPPCLDKPGFVSKKTKQALSICPTCGGDGTIVEGGFHEILRQCPTCRGAGAIGSGYLYREE